MRLIAINLSLPQNEIALRELIARLLEANEQFNLTAIREPGAAWNKHVLDGLWGLETGVFSHGARVLDVGSGAGFPGLVLALERRDLRLMFLEATRKKCGFIEAMSAHFNLGARVIHARAEEAGHDNGLRGAFDVVTARALGAFAEVSELCLPFLKIGGHMVLWRGQEAPTETQNALEALETLGGSVSAIRPYRLENLDTQYHLVTVQKKRATPKTFPRGVGIPKRKPLSEKPV